jgi:hypothetical protein
MHATINVISCIHDTPSPCVARLARGSWSHFSPPVSCCESIVTYQRRCTELISFSFRGRHVELHWPLAIETRTYSLGNEWMGAGRRMGGAKVVTVIGQQHVMRQNLPASGIPSKRGCARLPPAGQRHMFWPLPLLRRPIDHRPVRSNACVACRVHASRTEGEKRCKPQR